MSQTQIPEDLLESQRRAEACWVFTRAVARLADSLRPGSQKGALIDLEAQVVTNLYQNVREDKRAFASEAAAEDIIRASITLATGEPQVSWHERAWAIADEVVQMLMAAGVWWGKSVPREKVTDPDLEDWAPRETTLAKFADRLQEIVSMNREILLAGIRFESVTAADRRREREGGDDHVKDDWSEPLTAEQAKAQFNRTPHTINRWIRNDSGPVEVRRAGVGWYQFRERPH